jgi:hypothetical protein
MAHTGSWLISPESHVDEVPRGSHRVELSCGRSVTPVS